MDIDSTSPTSKPVVDREKTCPFLLRTFVKVGGFHRVALFEDNSLPTADEHQIYTWKDATLRELVTALRALPPNPLSTTFRHSSSRFQFRVVFADPTSRGRIATKDLGTVHSRDLLPSASLTAIEDDINDTADRERERERKASAEERTLEELRVQPGDWLCVNVIVPASKAAPVGPGLSIRGGASAANGGKSGGESWGGAAGSAPAPTHGKWGKIDPDSTGGSGAGERGGAGHWRGGGRGGGPGRGGPDDRRARRDSPPRRGGFRRGSTDDHPRERRRSRSRSRTRSPPRNRRGS